MLQLLAVLAVICAVCARVPSTVPDRNKAVDQYVRGCYYTNWSHYRQGRGLFWPEDYIKGVCTHMFYAYGWMSEDYTVRAYDEQDADSEWCFPRCMFDRVNNQKLKDPNLKTLLSIGGWTFGTRLFIGMTQNAQTRATFINSAIAYVRKHGFDGIDIDWEYPSGSVDIINFSALFKELRAAVDAEASRTGRTKLLVTCAVAAGKSNIDNGYDPQSFHQYVDFINIMSYDFHGAWEQFTGMNAPLYEVDGDPVPEFNIDFAAKYWVTKGVPAAKLNIGLASYGRGWTLADPNNNGIWAPAYNPANATEFVREAGVGSYYEFCEMLAKGAKRTYVKQAEQPYLIYNNNQWFSYDDVESITAKVNYIKANGFGGGFVWALDLDDFNGQCSNGGGKKYPLMSVIAKELGGIDL